MTIQPETTSAGLALACALLAGLAFVSELDARRAHATAVVASEGLRACRIAAERADAKLETIDRWMVAAQGRGIGGIGGGR